MLIAIEYENALTDGELEPLREMSSTMSKAGHSVVCVTACIDLNYVISRLTAFGMRIPVVYCHEAWDRPESMAQDGYKVDLWCSAQWQAIE